MKKMIVYRLENSQGIGPFIGGHRDEAELLKGHLGIRNCLVDFGIMKPRMFKKFSNNGWLCAWSSEADFNEWLNDKHDYFESLGYFKVVYEVAQYKQCGNQKLFHYDEENEDYVSILIDGNQVFFNPRRAVKVE